MKMPKPLVELHVHLDGSLRLETMIDIAAREEISLPGWNTHDLYRALRCGEIRHSLADYLEAFAVTTRVMQSLYALERIAEEFVEDAAKAGLKYVEGRFMPALHTERGLTEEAVTEAVLTGLRKAGARYGVGWGLIICSMRHVDPAITGRMVDLSIRYRDSGVVAFDMAGDDKVSLDAHADHLRRVDENGVPFITHAGESSDTMNVYEAILLGAKRIGHGTKALEDPYVAVAGKRLDVLEVAWRRGVGFEVCVTSNIQTRGVRDFQSHPAKRRHKEVLLCLNTDNAMLAHTTMQLEYMMARSWWGWDADDLRRANSHAIEMSFATQEEKETLHKLNPVP